MATRAAPPVAFKDMTVVRKSSLDGQYRDVVYIVADVGDGQVPTLLEMPMRMLNGEDLKDDWFEFPGTEYPVQGELRTFSFSPQSRHGRDETDSDRGGPEWLSGIARAYVEATGAHVRVDVAPGYTTPQWPTSSRVGADRTTMFGDYKPVHEPAVIAHYSGSKHVELLGVGVQSGHDDFNECGLPALHVGGTLMWIPPYHRSIVTRDDDSGLLTDLLADCQELVTREGRAIKDWTWAEHRRMLFLAMTDGQLVSLTLTDKGLAWAEHEVEGYAVLNVAVVRGHRREPDTGPGLVEALSVALVPRGGECPPPFLVTMPLHPQDGARDTDAPVEREDFVDTFGLEEFPSIVETFELVPPEAYQEQDKQVSPDALIVEAYSDKPYLHDELEGRMVLRGYGDASVGPQEGKGVAFSEVGGPYYTEESDAGVYRKRTVVAQSLYSEDTDYAVELRYQGAAQLDIHGVALRFNEEGNPLAALKDALENT